MIGRGTILFDIVAIALALWTARLVRRDRLYVGYGVIVLLLLGAGVVLMSVPAPWVMGFVSWFTGSASPVVAIGIAAVLAGALLVIYMLSQLTIISNRLTTVVQELALDHADASGRPRAAKTPEDQ
jgi:uncharacterized protein DUF2304